MLLIIFFFSFSWYEAIASYNLDGTGLVYKVTVDRVSLFVSYFRLKKRMWLYALDVINVTMFSFIKKESLNHDWILIYCKLCDHWGFFDNLFFFQI